MFGLEDIMCCRDYEEEDYLPLEWLHSPIHANMDHCRWNVIDGGKSAQESVLREEQIIPLPHKFTDESSMFPPTNPINPGYTYTCRWVDCASPQARFSVLGDWATSLRALHAQHAVHGNLTQESVGLVNGRGTLRNPGLTRHLGRRVRWSPEPSSYDDVHGARWAATELFRIDNDNPSPTKMSDVYSFACLMLQMLTGEVPYCGTKRSEQVVYLKYLGREPIDTQTPNIADRYVAFMRWCWSPEPEKRPTMETVVDFIHGEIKRLGEHRSYYHAAEA